MLVIPFSSVLSSYPKIWKIFYFNLFYFFLSYCRQGWPKQSHSIPPALAFQVIRLKTWVTKPAENVPFCSIYIMLSCARSSLICSTQGSDSSSYPTALFKLLIHCLYTSSSRKAVLWDTTHFTCQSFSQWVLFIQVQVFVSFYLKRNTYYFAMHCFCFNSSMFHNHIFQL